MFYLPFNLELLLEFGASSSSVTTPSRTDFSYLTLQIPPIRVRGVSERHPERDKDIAKEHD